MTELQAVQPRTGPIRSRRPNGLTPTTIRPRSRPRRRLIGETRISELWAGHAPRGAALPQALTSLRAAARLSGSRPTGWNTPQGFARRIAARVGLYRPPGVDDDAAPSARSPPASAGTAPGRSSRHRRAATTTFGKSPGCGPGGFSFRACAPPGSSGPGAGEVRRIAAPTHGHALRGFRGHPAGVDREGHAARSCPARTLPIGWPLALTNATGAPRAARR